MVIQLFETTKPLQDYILSRLKIVVKDNISSYLTICFSCLKAFRQWSMIDKGQNTKDLLVFCELNWFHETLCTLIFVLVCWRKFLVILLPVMKIPVNLNYVFQDKAEIKYSRLGNLIRWSHGWFLDMYNYQSRGEGYHTKS